MSDLKAIEYKRFEDIKHINENGSEYWSARELAVALDYVQWRNFEKVIKRAMILLRSAKSWKLVQHTNLQGIMNYQDMLAI